MDRSKVILRWRRGRSASIVVAIVCGSRKTEQSAQGQLRDLEDEDLRISVMSTR